MKMIALSMGPDHRRDSTESVLAMQVFLDKAVNHSPADTRGYWRVAAMAVVGGFFCNIDENARITNATGVISPPSRQRPLGLIDIAKDPNGLIFMLAIQNVDNPDQSHTILYHDPERNIRHGLFSGQAVAGYFSFSENAPQKPNLNLYVGFRQVAKGLVFKRHTPIADNPLPPSICYGRSDILIGKAQVI